jgi:hypothetical protein
MLDEPDGADLDLFEGRKWDHHFEKKLVYRRRRMITSQIGC